jgi:hypothetical protein
VKSSDKHYKHRTSIETAEIDLKAMRKFKEKFYNLAL